MAIGIWVNIGSGNGFLPDYTKPLPEPMLIYHQWGAVTFIEDNFTRDTSAINHQNRFENCLLEISFKSLTGQWVKWQICWLNCLCYPTKYLGQINFSHDLWCKIILVFVLDDKYLGQMAYLLGQNTRGWFPQAEGINSLWFNNVLWPYRSRSSFINNE